MPAPPRPPAGRGARSAAVCLVGALGLVVLPATATAGVQPAPQCVVPSQSRSPDVPPAQAQLAFERAWELTRGAGVLVAVVDTGVDGTIPQLAGRLAAGPNLIDGERPDTDCAGHGTFLAGIVAAAPAVGSGFAGVAPEAGLVAVRSRDGRERGRTAAPGPALRAAVDAGASVVLLGSPLPHGDAGVDDAVRYAADRDVLVVTPGFTVAQGVTPPDGVPDALVSVTALGPLPSSTRQTTGPFELAAPANDVTSVSRVSGGLVRGSGVEMAAAYVAGTAALVRSYGPGLTAAQVKRRLIDTAVLPLEQGGPRVLDPLGAVSTVLTDPPAADPLDRTPLAGVPLPVDDGSRARGLLLAAVGTVLALVCAVAAATLRARRRRTRV